LTCVCWSMISEIQMAYGSRVRRQGRSRACRRNHFSRLRTTAGGCGCFGSGRAPLERGDRGCMVAKSKVSAYVPTTFVNPLTSYTCPLAGPEAEALERLLRERGFEFREVPYARFAAQKGDVNLVFYQSGKLVVQGKGTRDFVEFVLEPEILKQARLGYETVLNPDLLLPRIGVDESGKGDFFGPLCIAGVYVNESVVRAWESAGVRDSKTISSDQKIADLARRIEGTPGCVSNVVAIGNEAYNRLYEKAGNVNAILAWGHARVIENLLQQKERMNPPPVRAISDQFARGEETIAKAMMPLGREIELMQRHKAEEDLAVAAASILARAEFVGRLKALGERHGIRFPKGASAEADAIAREFVARSGAGNLSKVAKMHFRNALRAQGLPEPPRTKWRKF
jgi:ribonuclease HIII